MALVTFSTWAAMLTRAKDILAQYNEAGKWQEVSFVDPDGVNITIRDPRAIMSYIQRLESLVEAEASGLKQHRPMAIRRTGEYR